MSEISEQKSAEPGRRRRVLITGGGSGTGAECAALLAPTHDLVLVGRRLDRLEETAERMRALGATVDVVAADVTARSGADIIAEAGDIDDLVLAAGLNSPTRTWADHTPEVFRAIVETNLISVAEVITAALPRLRQVRGTIIMVSSVSAWMTSPGAGVAYRASKMGLRALLDGLVEQEAAHGVRAGIVLPGDIDTEFMQSRPVPPGEDRRKTMLSAEDIARAVHFVLTSPAHVRIDELVITPVGSIER